MQTETRSPHFNRVSTASTYRDIHLPRVFTPWARVLVEVVPPISGEAVLDVATGPGTVAREAAVLVGSSGRVVGVDISPAMLAVARSFPREPGAGEIEYVEASATSIPLADAGFDLAYCQQGLQHICDPMAALREIHRLLRTGGRLGIATWVQSPFSLFREVVASMGVTGDGPQPSNFGREPAEFEAALLSAGFEEVHVQQREMVSVLEGGIPQALEVAVATSTGPMMDSLPASKREAIFGAITAALQPHVHDGAVHLKSVSNITSARKRGGMST